MVWLCGTLCGHVRHHPATVPPTPCTFSSAGPSAKHGQPPSNVVRPLTGIKRPSDSTLDAPPRQHRAPCTSTAIATPPTGATGQGRAPGMVRRLPRTTTAPAATPHSARQQGPSTVLPRFGEKGTNPAISHACNPSLLESIKGGTEAHSTGALTDRRTHIHLSPYWHLPQSTLAHLETWELPSLSRSSLYPLLQAPPVQDNTVFPSLLDVRL